MTPKDIAEENTTGSATVLIGGDHFLVRAGIRMLVVETLGAVGTVDADDCEVLVQTACTRRSLSLAVIDLSMPGITGVLQLDQLARHRPDLPLVILATAGAHELARQASSVSTVHAVIPRNAPASTIRLCILSASQRKRMGALNPAGRGSPRVETSALTPRQRQIRSLLRQGMSNKVIAATLNISEGTVKNHLTDIYRALNATNRIQAAQFPSELE